MASGNKIQLLLELLKMHLVYIFNSEAGEKRLLQSLKQQPKNKLT
jgi:hypothetical protein